MMASTLEHVIGCQQRLIAALDARDVDALEVATSELSDALNGLRAKGAVHDVERSRVDFAMNQAQAARIRVNVLADWTRQRIDQLAEVRSGPCVTYGKRTIYQPIR